MSNTVSTSSPLPRVDFYLLPEHTHQSIHQFCCRLVEKAWKLGNTVFVRAQDETQARLLDDLMWTYSDGSFLPHALQTTADAAAPVIIGTHTEPTTAYDLLINLADDVPTQHHHYQRIAEIINEDAGIKKHGRLRYAHYDSNKHPLQHHTINA